jgi:hypothetical protein
MKEISNLKIKKNLVIRSGDMREIQIEKTGFRIKSGMTQCVKPFLRYDTSINAGAF